MARTRFYIFPALLPLAEVLPWLLSAIAALAGATQGLRGTFWRRHRLKILMFAAACLVAAGTTVAVQLARSPPKSEGTRMTAEKSLPRTVHYEEESTAVLRDAPAWGFRRVWARKTKEEMLSDIVPAGSLLLSGTFGGTLDAYDAETGFRVWSLEKREPVYSPAAVFADRAYVGEGLHTAMSASLTAVSLPEGRALWQREFLGHLEAAPTVSADGKKLWVASGPLGLWALDTADGGVLWHARVGHTDARPLFSEGRLYVSAQPVEGKTASALYALDAESGKTLWRTELPGNTMGSPQSYSALSPVILTTAIGQVGPRRETDRGWAHAVGRDGKILWSVQLAGMPLPDGIISGDLGLFFLTLKTGEVTALRLADGSPVWTAKAGNEIFASSGMIVSGKSPVLATVSRDGRVSFNDARDGHLVQSLQITRGGYTAPLVVGDRLYLAAQHLLFAYNISGGVGQ